MSLIIVKTSPNRAYTPLDYCNDVRDLLQVEGIADVDITSIDFYRGHVFVDHVQTAVGISQIRTLLGSQGYKVILVESPLSGNDKMTMYGESQSEKDAILRLWQNWIMVKTKKGERAAE